jgi:hypothetical protein
MRVLLASAPHADTFGYSMPPPGLLRLGGALRDAAAAGAVPRVAIALEDLAYRLAAGDVPGGEGLVDGAAAWLLRGGPPDLLGLSTMGATLPAALGIAARVRAASPATRVVLGGPGTTGVDAALLERFPCVDAVARGEAEATLTEVVARGAFDGVRGVTWRDPAGAIRREPDRAPLADLARLPGYAYDLLPPIAAYKELHGEEEGLVPLDSGRGCVYDCSFCTIGRFWGRRSRPLPVARLAAEIEALRALPGARRAYLCHDLFAADRRHALELCDALVARGTGVPWEVRARVDHLDDELIERMGRAGCYRVLLGVESADPAVRERHAKRMRPDVDVLHVVERLAAAGITPILSLILGLPGEDDAGLEATLALALDASLAAGCNLSLHLVNPQPGCGLGDEHAAVSRPVAGIPPDMALGAGTTAAERELIDAHPDLFSTFALLTGEPGGVERLRALHALAAALPDALMARPRAFALARRRLGLSTRGLFDAWQARARVISPFDAFAASLGDPVLDDVLAWERAIERASTAAPSSRAELLRARYDLPRIAAALRAGAPEDATPRTTHLAVVPLARQPGASTLRVSEDVAALLAAPPEHLTPDARDALAARGLLRPEPSQPTSSPPSSQADAARRRARHDSPTTP